MRDRRRKLFEVALRAVHAGAYVLYWPSRLRFSLRRHPSRKLQVGSGGSSIPGWINADVDPRADLIVLIEKKLPFKSDALDRIYLEHVLEHATYEAGCGFLREALRVLAPGGVIRIAVPDLEDLARGYLHDDWRERFDWVKWPQFQFIESRAQMLNIAFRWWGHAHLYDRQELTRLLTDAGFREFEFVERGHSRHEDLIGLETRQDSTLVVEATKL